MIKNISDATNEAIGAKFVEWLKCEREYQAALRAMYSSELSCIEDCDDLNEGFGDKEKPTDKISTLERIDRMHVALKKQQAIYDELYELADLNIAGMHW